MITTLDAQPQEWMRGKSEIYHTVAACHFQNVEHIEYWINKLIPKNQNGLYVKWSGGRQKGRTREQFVENCFKYLSEIDFQVSCVSTSEGQMSWFAWNFYMQNQHLVKQRLDAKSRNCMVFLNDIGQEKITLPVLRAGYLIWYFEMLRYLVNFKKIQGRFLSDYFCCDGKEPGEGNFKSVKFLNLLLESHKFDIRVSVPKIDRYKQCDRISDYFCGWVNSVWSNNIEESFKLKLNQLENHEKKFIEYIEFNTNLKIVDENGNDISEKIKAEVVKG